MTAKRKKIILLVDDCSETTSFIKEILIDEITDYRLEILIRPDSLSALNTIRDNQGNIDLISTDIYHPNGNGIVFIQDCKAGYPHIPIIVCSGRASEIDAQQMQDSSLIRACFAKPFDVKEYVQAVREIFLSQKIVRPVFRSS